MYHFSDTQSHNFYGRKFYEIRDESGEIVAFSEAKFEIGPEVRFAGNAKIFASARILGGDILGGEIWGGVILGGEIWGGVIRGGVIRGGVIRDGVIRNGEIWGGEIRGGEIRGGVILGGDILGGDILGGEIWGGEIWDGEIRGGEIRGGVIRGGVIRGGEIRDGEIWGGEIWGGEIRGGVILGGVYKNTLLQIQGSRHFCYATPTDAGKIELGIGCRIYPISEWKKNYVEIGRGEGYTEAEVEEYGEYIALFSKRYGQ